MRVTVSGTSGSGKTTFARTLAKVIGARHIDLDAINWQPNWQDLHRGDPEEFKRRVLKYMLEHRLSLRQTAAHFDLGQSSQIGIWLRQHYSGSPEATLAKQRKSAVPKKIKPIKPTDTNDAEKSREQLLSELEYLRMENDVLKELKALREEKERTRTKKS